MADADAIVEALSADASALRQEGVGILLDHVLDQPIRALVDLEEAKAIVIQALTDENLSRIVTQHLKPGWKRYSDFVESSDTTVGVLVPEAARQPIRDVVSKSRLPRGKWVSGAVDPALFRKLFAPVSADVLIAFAQKLPIPGAGAAAGASAVVGREVVGGIAGRVRKGVQKRAGKLVDAGRSVMGGLGVEMEKRLQATARDFSEGALEVWRDALRDRLKSEEGRDILSQISRRITDHVLLTRIADIHEDTHRIPIEDVLDVVPKIVAHSTRQSFVQRIIDAEVAAFLEREGDRTLRDLFEEMNILDEVRGATLRKADGVARSLFASARFRGWLESVLDA